MCSWWLFYHSQRVIFLIPVKFAYDFGIVMKFLWDWYTSHRNIFQERTQWIMKISNGWCRDWKIGRWISSKTPHQLEVLLTIIGKYPASIISYLGTMFRFLHKLVEKVYLTTGQVTYKQCLVFCTIHKVTPNPGQVTTTMEFSFLCNLTRQSNPIPVQVTTR